MTFLHKNSIIKNKFFITVSTFIGFGWFIFYSPYHIGY
jgi:hypothetical protein